LGGVLFCQQSEDTIQRAFKMLHVTRFFNHVISQIDREFGYLNVESLNRTFQTFYTLEKLEKRLGASNKK
jgi:hypothetical protein